MATSPRDADHKITRLEFTKPNWYSLNMEQLKTYDNAEEFWRDVSPQLLSEEAKNCLGLGLSKTAITKPGLVIHQIAIFEKGKLAAAAICSMYETNKNLIPFPLKDGKKARVILESVRGAGHAFTNLIADTETAGVYRQLIEDEGYAFKVNMQQGIYRCREVKMPKEQKGLQFRVAIEQDIPLLTKWAEEFQNEACPHDPKLDYVKFATERVKNKMAYFLLDRGAPVSMAGWARDIGTSCAINLVYTPKVLRGKGYASFVTAKLTQLKLDEGRRETNLFTDMSNPTSNKIYQNIGYDFVCNSVHYGVQPTRG